MAAEKRKGFAFAVEDAPPPDRMGDKEEPKGDDGEEADDNAGLTSAVHDLAKAFGVKVADESLAIRAVRDICRLSEGDAGDDEG
jgi:hypothetical protein